MMLPAKDARERLRVTGKPSVSRSQTVAQAVHAIWQRGDTGVFLRLMAPSGEVEEFRYADLVERGLCWAHYYSRRGLKPGSHVVVILQHSFDLYAAYLSFAALSAFKKYPLGPFAEHCLHACFPSALTKHSAYCR